MERTKRRCKLCGRKEVWKTYPSNDNYEISCIGRARRKSYKKTFEQTSKLGKVHKRTINFESQIMSLCKHGNKESGGNTEYYQCATIGLIHIAVGITFIPNPFNKPEINHKNGNGLINCVCNLEWVTRSENQKHAYKIGLRTPNRHINKETGRYVKK